MDVEAIKDILSKKRYLTLDDIITLTGCSMRQARAYRVETLKTYDSTIVDGETTRAKVRTDKFMTYYDNMFLNELYREIHKIT